MSAWRGHVAGCASCAKRVSESASGPADRGDATSAEPPGSYGSAGSPAVPAAGLKGLDAGAPSPAADAIPGYKILKELHRGGQGVVYQAAQLSTKRKVALKVMLEGPFAGPESKRRFEREIALVGSLRHQNIVPIFDSGVAEGRFYYAMEYVRGEPLSVYVQRRKLSVDDTLRLFRKVCEAVDYAHQRGVIHRDLKPSNILVDENGEPYVLDFGLAKTGGTEIEGDSETQSMPVSVTGQVMGTLAYMSPEHAAGRLGLGISPAPPPGYRLSRVDPACMLPPNDPIGPVVPVRDRSVFDGESPA